MVAAKFKSTCNGVVVTNTTATTSIAVICASGLTASTCPDNYSYGTCTFAHKLCVTCSGSSTVRIRVQTNGLPLFCPNTPITLSELNIDFEVDFNPDVSINSPLYTPITTSALSSIVCNVNSQSSAPFASNLTALVAI
ncbi:unnamed protein product [Rotaria magnacalcarata]|uniref:Uncharacterized protein n=1 Tax=Rotaria magnacalcarata TaxID=392030 RepID=A0A816DPS9_9BILA|nr:unnamed protein product [Rotaria magnacalcarata]CAF1635723.1 unnamed protein product [Rotaria magnacalcarata]CAF2052838.1 unnamed protein product [Rotaria magnacalcarata]CAF4790375.1 unnamed protein product [Rotaria magnacalcarata]CAF5071203.1 unnamed protein product [Rotaria magnacalcarata]